MARGGQHLGGQNMAEGKGLDQLAVLSGRQNGIMHETSLGVGRVRETCTRAS